MPEVPQRVQVSCVLPHTCGMTTGGILTQEGDENLKILPNPSPQFGEVARMTLQSLGTAAVTPGTAGLQLPISWISRWKRQMHPDKLMGVSLGESNK